MDDPMEIERCIRERDLARKSINHEDARRGLDLLPQSAMHLQHFHLVGHLHHLHSFLYILVFD